MRLRTLIIEKAEIARNERMTHKPRYRLTKHRCGAHGHWEVHKISDHEVEFVSLIPKYGYGPAWMAFG